MDNISFITTDLATRINHAEQNLIHLYKINGYDDAAKALTEELAQITDDRKIRVVFIGQYTAGKSTIISALTGNDEIKIDSDVATLETTDYCWGDVVLTDTPGLYTENPEHDAKTIETIRKSDLLIYCITSDLFNQYTLADFENWAYTTGYAGKMFLIINKVSKEAGTQEELINNYCESLNKALLPHSIGEFPHSFVDAQDYRDGVHDADQELIEYSNFPSFISKLNSFVEKKGYLGKLDTPIMIMKASVDEMSQVIASDDSNRAYSALVSRIEKKIDQKRNQFSLEARSVIRRGLKPITDKGNDLSRILGIEDIDETEDSINEFIAETCKKINDQLIDLCARNVDELNSEIEEVLESDTASFFFNSISGTYSEKKSLFKTRENRIDRAKFESVKSVVESITGKTIKMATNGGAETGKFLLQAAETSGSKLHNVVLSAGKSLGVKFKPWQAVNIAKNLGNVAKCLGPALAVLGLFLDVKETVDEEKRVKKIKSAQLEFRQQFVGIHDELEKQYYNELGGMFTVYDDIIVQLQNARDSVQKLINADNDMLNQLYVIRGELVQIQSEIF